MNRKHILLALISLMLFNCKGQKKSPEDNQISNTESAFQVPFDWQSANVYFLLTDRFNNGDTSNDVNFERNSPTGMLRGFEGGDIKGITQKVKEGYFTDLGINAIWLTPVNEQIHGATDEGTGLTYGYHGYWIKDWTAIDPNYGTKDDLRNLVDEAHKRGIRILLDAVINHTGPVTDKDPVWPKDWVRTQPQCQYNNYENTVTCTLVKNLPDVKTESNANVELPPQLVKKWKAEGRYEQEVAELDAFFKRTGYPRAPRFYIIKWLTDYITDYGIDGYRCDTVKHTEAFVWQELRTECDYAFKQFKTNHPDKVLDDNDFYLVSEVYNYGISSGQYFDFGDKKVNYFDHAFNSAINFEFKWNAKQMLMGDLFVKYDSILHTDLKNYGVLNYLSSHDDGQPFDPNRQHPKAAANILLLAPGAAQIYYGDEIARPLKVDGAVGDANLRSKMDWNALSTKETVLEHWQKLGRFRANHPAVGAGRHQVISDGNGFVFSRTYQKNNYTDKVVVAILNSHQSATIDVSSVFENGDELRDAYSGKTAEVKNGTVTLDVQNDIVLLEKTKN